ncbi:MAG: TRAM domain-containing protein [Halobacteriaceae archaeon]
MADCPLADECPHFQERIQGMGCQHYGDRGGMEWCKHYNQPIEDLKTAPVVPGEEVVVEVSDLHESGAGIGHTEDGFVVMVEGALPPARARVKVETVKSNYARGDLLEKLPMDEEDVDADDEDESASEESEAADEGEDEGEGSDRGSHDAPRLGSRDNFWGS